jgi:hypothetical protein
MSVGVPLASKANMSVHPHSRKSAATVNMVPIPIAKADMLHFLSSEFPPLGMKGSQLSRSVQERASEVWLWEPLEVQFELQDLYEVYISLSRLPNLH